MSPARTPLFLARRAYRRRRMRDAARMLPWLGLFLFALPMLWPPDQPLPGLPPPPTRDSAFDGLWLVVSWAGLIAVTALLAPQLHGPDDDPAGSLDDEPDDAPPLDPGSKGPRP